MTFTAHFEGSPLSTGRSKSLLIMQSIEAASLDYFYKIELRWHLPSGNTELCFQLRENKDHREAALSGDTRYLDKLQELFKTHQILLFLGHSFMKMKLLRQGFSHVLSWSYLDKK